MTDIAIAFNGTEFDIGIEKGDLCRDDGLETAVIISLYTNQRVTEDDLDQLASNKMGWWGDTLSEIEGDQIGSRLWLLDRTKISDENLTLFESYATDALAWMIEDDLASNVSVVAETSENGMILDIEITKQNSENIAFSYIWDGQEIKRA